MVSKALLCILYYLILTEALMNKKGRYIHFIDEKMKAQRINELLRVT